MQRTQLCSRRVHVHRLLWLCSLSLIISARAGQHFAHAAEQHFLAGKLLVATPDMKDPRFAESVIYVVKHDAASAMGLVINKPMTTVALDKLLEGFGEKSKTATRDIVIHYGGPVGSRQGFLLHSDETMLPNSIKVGDGIAMTADIKMLEAMARAKGPRQSLFMLGYAGWAPAQLEAELKINSWFVISGDKALIFGSAADKKWRQAVDKRQIPL